MESVLLIYNTSILLQIIFSVQKVMLKLKILSNERERERERERELLM